MRALICSPFGSVLYEMATGALPFRGETARSCSRHSEPASGAVVRLNPDASATVEVIINKLLEKDRELRYQGAAEVARCLKRLKRDNRVWMVTAAVLSSHGLRPSSEKKSQKPLELCGHGFGRYRDRRSVHDFLRAAQQGGDVRERSILLADFVNTTADPVFDGTLNKLAACFERPLKTGSAVVFTKSASRTSLSLTSPPCCAARRKSWTDREIAIATKP